MLTVSALLDRARERTGQSDFGDEFFIEPMQWLVDSINHDSELTKIGEQMVPELLIRQLVNRLELESCYKRHPEIEDVPIVAPVFGLGLPRTGSTALGYMLSLDSNTRVLRGWEAATLCPPPATATEHTDPRIAIAQAEEDAIAQLVPKAAAMLPQGVTGPAECALLLMMSFASSKGYETTLTLPSYAEKVDSQSFDMEPAYQFHLRVLKLLQWRCPPTRWYLRTPLHTFDIEALCKVYPDARFTMTHRDPVKVLTSACSLMHSFRKAFVKNPDPKGLGKAMPLYWLEAIKRTLAVREKIGEARFIDISHTRQVLNPAEQIPGLYQKLGWELDDTLLARIDSWAKSNPKGSHKPTPAQFEIDEQHLQQAFKGYTQRFASYL